MIKLLPDGSIEVLAYGTVLSPDRVTAEGRPFHLDTPDFVVAVLELANGTVVRLTANFYVGFHSKQKPGIEFHGDRGSLYLSNWHDFNGTVEYADFGGEYTPVPYVKEPYRGPRTIEWGRAVLDMAHAIAQNRPHRATGEQAAHVVEILCAIKESLETNKSVSLSSGFRQPELMDWTKEASL